MIRKTLWTLLFINLLASASAFSNVSNAEMSSKRAAVSFNHDIEVAAFSAFSVQIELADAAPAAVTRTMNRIAVDDTIYIEDHNLPTGLGVVLSTANNYIPTGLDMHTTYYVIAYQDDYIKLAASANDASAGTAVDITAIPSVSSASITFTPQPLASAATDGITYQASNDGVTFYAISATTAPYDAVTVGALTQIVDPTYKLLRLKFTGPTTGALSIKANLTGRR